MKIQSLASDKRKPNIFFSVEKKKKKEKKIVLPLQAELTR